MSDNSNVTPFASSSGGLRGHTLGSTTTHFRTSLAIRLQPVSPSLAAYHVARSRALGETPSDFGPLVCPRCGSMPCSTSLARPSTRLKTVRTPSGSGGDGGNTSFVTKRCPACRNVDVQKVEQTDASSRRKREFPMVRRRGSTNTSQTLVSERQAAGDQLVPNAPTPKPIMEGKKRTKIGDELLADSQASTQRSSKGHNPLHTPGSSKDRVKVKRGLEDMLARNREQKVKKDIAAQGHTLAGFLGSLS